MLSVYDQVPFLYWRVTFLLLSSNIIERIPLKLSNYEASSAGVIKTG